MDLTVTSRLKGAIRRIKPDWIHAVGWTCLFLLLSACSGSTGNRVMVKLVHTPNQELFEPASLTVSKGTTVVWQNNALWAQSVTCDPTKAKDHALVSLPQGAQAWDSGILYPGQTWSYTFNTSGTYLYFSQTADSPATTGTIEVR